MPSRADREAKVTTPPQTASGPPPMHPASVQDHNFYLQCSMEIQRAVGKLEHAVVTLTSTTENQAEKLDKINDDVVTAKGMAKAFGWVLSALGAIGIALLGSILTVLLKHFKLL